ncbi:rhodanese-like domain-containing protein [Aureispira sp. CCB-QB1]|uniref:rhodanese-like domain-containing protein n=1 Tax=Aureispira sp. CCB-QB1 TaxID=1313421 RepID=UPI000695E218|nr:rhodanese-like domain-containing protein [Aureispira sp. CCB-QB1]
MKLLNLFAISLLSLTVFIACGNGSVASVEQVELLSCKDFDQKIKETESVQLIDVRTSDEFAGGTIGSAINIDFFGENFKEEMAKLDLERPVFVFCAKGGRSGKASAICKELGFKKIYDLDGGYTAWSQYEK